MFELWYCSSLSTGYVRTYDNSGHGNDNGKVNYITDNKMPQQMAFHGVVCCLHRCQIVNRLWYVKFVAHQLACYRNCTFCNYKWSMNAN